MLNCLDFKSFKNKKSNKTKLGTCSMLSTWMCRFYVFKPVLNIATALYKSISTLYGTISPSQSSVYS